MVKERIFFFFFYEIVRTVVSVGKYIEEGIFGIYKFNRVGK